MSDSQTAKFVKREPLVKQNIQLTISIWEPKNVSVYMNNYILESINLDVTSQSRKHASKTLFEDTGARDHYTHTRAHAH